MILQLDPPIPLRTPKGAGLAVLVIDYGPDHDLLWTVILGMGDHAGEVWTYRNPDVRGVDNVTLGRASRHPAKLAAVEPRALNVDAALRQSDDEWAERHGVIAGDPEGFGGSDFDENPF